MNNPNKNQIGLLINDDTLANLNKLRASLTAGTVLSDKTLSVSDTIRYLINSAAGKKSPKKNTTPKNKGTRK